MWLSSCTIFLIVLPSWSLVTAFFWMRGMVLQLPGWPRRRWRAPQRKVLSWRLRWHIRPGRGGRWGRRQWWLCRTFKIFSNQTQIISKHHSQNENGLFRYSDSNISLNKFSAIYYRVSLHLLGAGWVLIFKASTAIPSDNSSTESLTASDPASFYSISESS